jgi:hypothetical protein
MATKQRSDQELPAMPDGDNEESFTVRVDNEEWGEVQSLAQAGPQDRVFAVDSTGTVVFGDGISGRRPSTDATVTVSYRQGGAVGNVQVSITTLWPPREGRYLIALKPAGVCVNRAAIVDCFSGNKRLRYFDGQLLTAADFQEEQRYLIRMRHRQNRALGASGVVGGLAVTISSDAPAPSIMVEPGLAIDRKGRELELPASVVLEIGNQSGPLYVIAEYTERETDPVPSPTDSRRTTASRIEEGLLIRLSAEDTSDDGVVLARLVLDSTGWKTDSAFEPSRTR